MSAGTWYVTAGRTAVNWGTAVSGGVATVDIGKLVVGTVNEQLFLFARTGQAVSADQVAAAQAETTVGAVPAAIVPYGGLAPGGASASRVALYGASSAVPTSIPANTTVDLGASVTFTTTTANTKWLVEVDADVAWGTGASSSPNALQVQAKVDGAYKPCSGGVSVSIITSVGYEVTELPVRGRCVVTLAAAGSHTITAAAAQGNGAATAVVVNAVTVSATQLS